MAYFVLGGGRKSFSVENNGNFFALPKYMFLCSIFPGGGGAGENLTIFPGGAGSYGFTVLSFFLVYGACSEGSVKLDNGIPYIFHENEWKAVCAHFARGSNTDNVICKKLGYRYGTFTQKGGTVIRHENEGEYYVGGCSDVTFFPDHCAKQDDVLTCEAKVGYELSCDGIPEFNFNSCGKILFV